MVDLTLPSELQKLAEQMNKQVEHFPAYRAIIVRGQPKVNWHDSCIEMIFREGRKYRQELLPESLSRVGVPKHVFATDDLNEWASKEWDKYKWMTLVVSKGNETAVAEYSLRPNEETPTVQFKPSRVITASSSIRSYLPRMSPELICYPDLSFANGMACTIQPNCLDLAFPTTKVEVRFVTQDLSDNSGLRYYCYWFDPKRGFAAVQWERCTHLPEENPTTGTYSREKYRIEEQGKTSEGVWFPLRVIYSIQNKNEPVCESWIRYCLDFSPQDSKSIYEFKERSKK
jgi:hypothetical protein